MATRSVIAEGGATAPALITEEHLRDERARDGGVSWAAIFAGATAAAALSLVLFTLGTGLDLSAVSIWSGQGANGETIGWATIGWLTFTQLAAATVGGYLAGRLRRQWIELRGSETFFRDTAHGFLSWALATILLFIAVGIAGGSVAKDAGKAAMNATASTTSTVNYWAAALLRDAPAPTATSSSASNDERTSEARDRRNMRLPIYRSEHVAAIFQRAIETGKLPASDARYLGRIIAATSDLSTTEAESRVLTTFDNLKADVRAAKAKAETARKMTAYSLLWVSISLFIGAFVASVSATFGGRLRDSL